MMLWIGFGFWGTFVLAFWVAGWPGGRAHSSLLGALVGLLGFCMLMTGYVALLYLRVRAQLFAFIESELPLFINRFLGIVEQLLQLRETI